MLGPSQSMDITYHVPYIVQKGDPNYNEGWKLDRVQSQLSSKDSWGPKSAKVQSQLRSKSSYFF